MQELQKKIWKKNFEIFFPFFLMFFTVLKVRRPGRKTSCFRTVRILKILRTSGPDMMSGRALTKKDQKGRKRAKKYYERKSKFVKRVKLVQTIHLGLGLGEIIRSDTMGKLTFFKISSPTLKSQLLKKF